MPVAKPRSFVGNHSATAFTAAGKFPASPIPNPILATLNPGASLQEIEEIQHILGVSLPEDYVASCLIHNGQNQELPK